MIVGLRNIWIILRRNVIYFIVKKPRRLSKLPDMMSVICGILGAENKRKLICNSPNDVISETLMVKKSIKINFFNIKIHYISS
jgi:hypothetical protein